jgi:hypothetical protein
MAKGAQNKLDSWKIQIGDETIRNTGSISRLQSHDSVPAVTN